MLIAAIFKSTQYTMAFPSSTLAWKQGHASPKARLAPFQSRENEVSPCYFLLSPPTPSEKPYFAKGRKSLAFKYFT